MTVRCFSEHNVQSGVCRQKFSGRRNQNQFENEAVCQKVSCSPYIILICLVFLPADLVKRADNCIIHCSSCDVSLHLNECSGKSSQSVALQFKASRFIQNSINNLTISALLQIIFLHVITKRQLKNT